MLYSDFKLIRVQLKYVVSETWEPSNSLCDKTVMCFHPCYLFSYPNLDDISVPYSNISFILKINFLGPSHNFKDIFKYSLIYQFF